MPTEPKPAWVYTWTCACGKQRIRLAWTRCQKCGMQCPEPSGNDPWPEDNHADD